MECHRCQKQKTPVVIPAVTTKLLIIKDLHGVSQVSQAKNPGCDTCCDSYTVDNKRSSWGVTGVTSKMTYILYIEKFFFESLNKRIFLYYTYIIFVPLLKTL
jgi:hypothetical protein